MNMAVPGDLDRYNIPFAPVRQHAVVKSMSSKSSRSAKFATLPEILSGGKTFPAGLWAGICARNPSISGRPKQRAGCANRGWPVPPHT